MRNGILDAHLPEQDIKYSAQYCMRILVFKYLAHLDSHILLGKILGSLIFCEPGSHAWCTRNWNSETFWWFLEACVCLHVRAALRKVLRFFLILFHLLCVLLLISARTMHDAQVFGSVKNLLTF